MYSLLLAAHSLWRWLVLLSLLYAIFRGIRGQINRLPFLKADNTIRHVTATIAHIQLTIGYALYFSSPVISYFRSQFRTAVHEPELLFFGLIHVIGMTISIILITIGSSLAKRKTTDMDKFRSMTAWFILALIVIFITIPWPFSPLANRPYLRHF
jgi:hypothetical protein